VNAYKLRISLGQFRITREMSPLTVANMPEIVNKVKYAPTIGTARLSLFHHQMAVVPK